MVKDIPRPEPVRVRTFPWIAHLAAGCCYAGAAWIVARELWAPALPAWLAAAADFRWYAFGLLIAGWWWFLSGLRDKGWAHLVAAVLFALPRLYTLPTDLLGIIPAVGLSLAIGAYLHISLARDQARLTAAGFSTAWPGLIWAAAAVLPLVMLHVAIALAHASLKAEYLALK